jgi:exosortase A
MNAVPSVGGAVTPTALNPGWRRALPLWLAVVAWIGFWYRDNALAMWAIWTTSDTYAHGMVVVPIALWLAWRRRDHLARLTPRPTPWALALMAGVALVWFAADLVAVNAATQFAFVALVVLSVPAVLGVDVGRALMFPLGFLFFAVPFGDFMLGPLMEGTADFTVAALRMTGVPVWREGLSFVVPTGTWSVVEECSGVRYLIASVMVGSLFAYLNYHSTNRRLIFVGISILVPIVANWLRAYMIVMLGYLSGNKIAAGADHILYGWVFFGVVIMIMFLIGMRWAEPDEVQPATVAGRPTTRIAGSAAFGALLVGAFGAVLVSAAPHAALAGLSAMERSDAPNLVPVGNTTAGWRALAPGSIDELPDWKPAFQNPGAELAQAFARNGQAVGLYLAYYRQQNYERKLVSASNKLVKSNDDVWSRSGGGRRSVELGDRRLEVRTTELRGSGLLAGGDGRRLHVWQIYWVNGKWVEADVAAKLEGALARVMGRGDESAVMVLFTPRVAGTDPGQTLTDFLSANLAPIEQALVATRDGPPLTPVAAR